jgi:prepilin-type N-terminal cleavage/methylation domain-containing protein
MERHKSMNIQRARQRGFTLIEIMIVVALVGLLASIATPTWVKARTSSQANTCINNLRQIDGAKQQWALESKQSTNATPAFTDISDFLKSAVVCPAAGTSATFANSYNINNLATKPTCQVAPSLHIETIDTSN